MSYRPRLLAARSVVLLAFTSACTLEVDLRDSSFMCSLADPRCPAGLVCVDTYCLAPGEDPPDAGEPTERDAEPPDPVSDAAVFDAAPLVEGIDAGGGGLPCLGEDAVSDPTTGHCFRLIRSPSRAWSEAGFACQTLGAYLATIESAEEQAVVASLQDGSEISTAWIGGSDQAAEGAWVWVDGAPFAYTNWDPGEPNDYGDGEDCAVIRFSREGRWDDRSCSGTLSFVCEQE
jgi:hypothetical protein